MGPRAAPNRISPLKGLGAGNADERRQGRCPAGFKLGWQPPCVTSYTDWCRRADRVPAARLACRLPPANPTLHFLFGFNACGCRRPYDDVYLEPNQVDGEVGQPFRSTLRRSILDHDVLALDPPHLTQTLSKCLRRCELELDKQGEEIGISRLTAPNSLDEDSRTPSFPISGFDLIRANA